MSSSNSRFKSLGFGSKRKSTGNPPTLQSASSSTPHISPLAGRPASIASSSSSSIPMNHQPGGGRPPSYSNNYAPAPAAVGRTTSPLANNGPRTPPSQMMGGPPPINTVAGYPPGHPQSSQPMGGPPGAGGPPQYHPPQYGVPGQGSVAAAQYANRNNAVEVEGAGKSKAQLIVGIDFVSSHALCQCFR